MKCLIQSAKTLACSLLATPALAYDINEQLEISGTLAGTIQCQKITSAPGFSDTCAGAIPFQPKMSLRPTMNDELFLKLGFAAGNGLNEKTPFVNAPWAADLENNVKNINGSDRDYLLTAWYKHTFSLGDDRRLRASIGIIDATDYLDENAYANDEYTQFMNATLTNGPNVFLPSYDLGIALEWNNRSWSFTGVLMDIGENEDGNNYSFYGLQASYRINNRLGAGNYRVVLTGTSEDFPNPAGNQLEVRRSNLYSFDQAFGKVIRGWVRFGWQSKEAAINYHGIFSGGIDIKGTAWGRHGDNIGLGYAYLSGGNLDIDKTNVAEAYYRWQLGQMIGLTVDIQYQHDNYKLEQDPSGWTAGVRTVIEF